MTEEAKYDVFELDMECPECDQVGGVRLMVPEEVEDAPRVICKECEDLDVEVDFCMLAEALSAILHISSDAKTVESSTIKDLVIEKLELA